MRGERLEGGRLVLESEDNSVRPPAERPVVGVEDGA